jgi:hypothetical protein
LRANCTQSTKAFSSNQYLRNNDHVHAQIRQRNFRGGAVEHRIQNVL